MDKIIRIFFPTYFPYRQFYLKWERMQIFGENAWAWEYWDCLFTLLCWKLLEYVLSFFFLLQDRTVSNGLWAASFFTEKARLPNSSWYIRLYFFLFFNKWFNIRREKWRKKILHGFIRGKIHNTRLMSFFWWNS